MDLQPEFLARVHRKLAESGVGNFTCAVGGAGRLPCVSKQFDVVFMVAVFGELADQTRFLQEACRVLKPSGILSVTEQLPDPDFVSREDLRAAIEGQGFEFAGIWDTCFGYTTNFRKADVVRSGD